MQQDQHIRKTAFLAVGTALLASSCINKSGSGGSSAVTIGFASGGTNCTEGNSEIITLELTLNIAALEEDASVDIVDAGSGIAGSGSDYTAFPTTTITFPAGSVSGATRTIQIDSLADNAMEGPETIALRLQNASGTALGANSAFNLLVEDVDTASVSFVNASSTAPDESAATRSVALELHLSPGVSLERDLVMSVDDVGSGSATPGADYQNFQTTSVTFPATSVDGVQESIAVQILDDANNEANETIQLEIADISLVATASAPATHTLTITDDDGGGGGAMFAASGGGGAPLSDGSAINLGSQQDGAGANAGIPVTLANQGGSGMQMAAPTVTGANVDDFVVEVTGAGFVAPGSTIAPEALASPVSVSLEDPLLGVEMSMDQDLLAALQSAGSHVLLEDFPLPGGETVSLELERLRSPWTTDAKVVIDGVESGMSPEEITGPLNLWKGRVRGHEESELFLGFSEVGARGWVNLSEAAEDQIHFSAGGGALTRAMAPQQLLALGASAPTQAEFCGGEAFPPGFVDDPQQALIVPGAETSATVTVADCRLAIETDTQFFAKFGSVGDATTYVTELIAAISDRYLADVQTTMSIAYLGLHSNGVDTWTTPDGPGNTSQMLDEFVAAWSPNTSAGWPASADLAHFLSGASIGGGRAYVNVICSQTSGFGVSGVNGNSNWASFPTQSSWLNWDFVVVAHELGHNFNARHTHWYCPPIDQCSLDNCNSTQVCQTSTIMSYCHTCAGGLANIDLEFHPFIANEMRERVNASCLGDADLSAGSQVSYQVRFRPTSGPGAKSATLEITHDAANAPSPFTLNLSGTSTP